MYRGTIIEFLNMGGGEIMLILAVVLLLFGGKKLPELARGLGKGIRDFKDASEGVKREIHRNINSVGIVDDVESVINDTRKDFNHSSDATLEEQMYPNSVKSTIDFDKKDAVTESNTEGNSRIETDKTQL
ncbi:twin-arginine translocase TatA/TatE family subunit [Pedobacter metabolipauper]|uniref:Sec-independent protein translocase protein TatA n=1 Tax=Pedobacter metabolipauper TaxID=425513 RepID=A0A4R6SXA6_9SPHI|nr:twin-arginine translocase TatA/TatE family subunit [Pedobacter metabolipauper]TDQ10066.1 TatA/E family protein of Tat protein translocase [Pedobacter metabolipauper]